MPTPTLFGNTFQVNTVNTSGDQVSPHVSGLADGRLVVGWARVNASGLRNVAQAVINADGTIGVAETDVFSSTTGLLGFNQSSVDYLAVAALTGGGRVVVYAYDEDGGGSAFDENIYFSIFNVSGGVIASHQLANDGGTSGLGGTAGRQNDPDVVATPDGGFTIAWDSDASLAAGGIWRRSFTSTGVANGEAIKIDSNVSGGTDPALAVRANGEIVTAYEDNAPVQIESIFGHTASGGHFVMDGGRSWNGADNPNRQVDVAVTTGNAIVGVYTDFGVNGVHLWTIQASFNGGNAFQVNTTALATSVVAPDASVVALRDGNVLVVWNDGGSDNYGIGWDVLGQLFSSAGTQIGSEFEISTAASYSSLLSLEAAQTIDGRVLVTWSAAAGPTSSSEVYAQFVDPRQSGITFNGTALGEQVIGTPFSDFLYGNDGDDILRGEGGGDVLRPGLGTNTVDGGGGTNDTLSLFDLPAGVFVLGATGSGTYAYAGGSVTYSGIEQVDGSNLGDDHITGNDQNNALLGNFGNDTLLGMGGVDYLFGQDGNDVLDGGAGTDEIYGDAGDDTVIYDAADIISDGGTGGFDTLQFSGPTAPTSFDLTNGNFERARGIYADPGGNPWSVITSDYTPSWQLKTERVDNDDTSFKVTNWDTDGSLGTLHRYTDYFSAAGGHPRTAQEAYNDGGTSGSYLARTTVFYASGQANYIDDFNTSGQRTSQEYFRSDGTRQQTTVWDVTGSLGTIDFYQDYFNAGGQRTSQTVYYDNRAPGAGAGATVNGFAGIDYFTTIWNTPGVFDHGVQYGYDLQNTSTPVFTQVF